MSEQLNTIKDVLCGEHKDFAEAELRPINLLGEFLKELRRPEVAALCFGDDPDSYCERLVAVEKMQRELSVFAIPSAN